MNRRLISALFATALLAVPAGAAATQIVLPGVTDQLVEGHTVFSVIEKARFENRTIEAAAVAVLIRERPAVKDVFKGVLWFNDQYLVSPYARTIGNLRHPCGGAVLAVNSGDPDPRTMLVSYNQADQYQQQWNRTADEYDTLAQEDSAYEDPDPAAYRESADYSLAGFANNNAQEPGGTPRRAYDNGAAINDAGTPGYNGAPATPGAVQPRANSWLDYDEDDNLVTSSAITGVTEYVESYLITDPNDHTWIVDKYIGISTVAVSADVGTLGTVALQKSTFPLWVVNIHGKPTFTPDDGFVACTPFIDDPWQQSAINSGFVAADNGLCAQGLPVPCPSGGPGAGVDTNGDGIPADGLDARPPAIGYYEPTDPASNGGASYCYDGSPRQNINTGRSPGSGCATSTTFPDAPGEDPLLGFPETTNLPGGGVDNPGEDASVGELVPNIGTDTNRRRYYNAVLYFYLGPNDVYITGAAPHGDDDTNGCEETASYNGIHGPIPKRSTRWLCPAGDDDAEGNSHPFNPPGIYVPSAFDPTSGAQLAGTGTWYDIWSAHRECSLGYATSPALPLELDTPPKAACNQFEHATHNRGGIDIYFSPTARPLEPPVRAFAELDYEGRTDEFHENNQPQPRTHPPFPADDFDPAPPGYLTDDDSARQPMT